MKKNHKKPWIHVTMDRCVGEAGKYVRRWQQVNGCGASRQGKQVKAAGKVQKEREMVSRSEIRIVSKNENRDMKDE